jgi:hypothetical protein
LLDKILNLQTNAASKISSGSDAYSSKRLIGNNNKHEYVLEISLVCMTDILERVKNQTSHTGNS